jgi:disulfide bond formation protein DsbB
LPAATEVTPPFKLAQRLAFAVPAFLLAGAFLSEYGFGLYPCEMCWWQRYPHFAAIILAMLSTAPPPRRLPVVLAALAILTSGLIGAFHAGVEYGWWEGITACASNVAQGADPLEAIMNAPLVRCDVAPWTLAGISLAGFNAVISTVSALAVFVLLAKSKPA